jgi:hypothetical protein
MPSARRTASRAAGARCKANRHEKEAASPLRRSSDPRDRRKLGPAIPHLLSAGRTAPRAAGARCKVQRHAPEAASLLRRRPDPRDRRKPGPADHLPAVRPADSPARRGRALQS